MIPTPWFRLLGGCLLLTLCLPSHAFPATFRDNTAKVVSDGMQADFQGKCTDCPSSGKDTTGSVHDSQFRIMAYNVENLFDTIHAQGKLDEEFTPQGERGWNSIRFAHKLSQLARTIAAASEQRPAALVALCEVENDSVLSHFTRKTKLTRLGYNYLITNSQDPRGLNVALLYQPAFFRPIQKDSIRVAPTHKRLHPSRDVLHVAGQIPTGDTLDIFVVHLPSRRNGKTSKTYREAFAKAIKHYTDSLFLLRQTPNLILMGDFNAYYPEKLFTRILHTHLPDSETPVEPRELYLLSHNLKAAYDIAGTYKFQGQWNQLDNFIISGTLLKMPLVDQRNTPLQAQIPTPPHPYTEPENCKIVDFPFLFLLDSTHETVTPFRSFKGNFYAGGFSDHLPLILDLFY